MAPDCFFSMHAAVLAQSANAAPSNVPHLQPCCSLVQLVTGRLLEAGSSHWLHHQHSGGQGSCHGLAQLLATLMRMAPGGAGC